MTQSIGRLLRDHREAIGALPADVAEQAHVPIDVLLAFEEGRGSISASALDRLSTALAIDPIELRTGHIAQRPTGTLFFRHTAYLDLADQDRARVSEALERAFALTQINAILQRPAGLRSKLGPEEPTPEAYKDGYRWARQTRALLGNDEDPLDDLQRLLEDRFDVLVRWEQLASPRISALAVKDASGAAAAIVLNASKEQDRRRNPLTTRVDLAHDLAHVLLDPPNDRVNLIVDENDPDEKSATLGERRARAFAAELLIPAEGLRKVLGPPGYETSSAAALDVVDRVRASFATPIEITVNHLVNREYVVHWLREWLIDELRRRPTESSTREPPAQRDVLERRVIDARERDLVTVGRARELLGLSAWDELPHGD